MTEEKKESSHQDHDETDTDGHVSVGHIDHVHGLRRSVLILLYLDYLRKYTVFMSP